MAKKRRNVFYQSSLVCVRRNVKHGEGGRGIYATQDIQSGQLIEVVLCILIPRTQIRIADNLAHYVFEWSNVNGKRMFAVALGYGSLYNHAYSANAVYKRVGKDFMHFIAVKNIKKGEEIFVNYNGPPNDKTEVWFESNK